MGISRLANNRFCVDFTQDGILAIGFGDTPQEAYCAAYRDYRCKSVYGPLSSIMDSTINHGCYAAYKREIARLHRIQAQKEQES